MSAAMRHIPLTFINKRHSLTWSQILVGVREDWLTRSDAIEVAGSELGRGNQDASVRDLANLASGEDESVVRLLERLAAQEGHDEKQDRLVWLRLLLAWIYENRDQVTNPLDIVEGLYADFGYPDEI